MWLKEKTSIHEPNKTEIHSYSQNRQIAYEQNLFFCVLIQNLFRQ